MKSSARHLRSSATNPKSSLRDDTSFDEGGLVLGSSDEDGDSEEQLQQRRGPFARRDSELTDLPSEGDHSYLNDDHYNDEEQQQQHGNSAAASFMRKSDDAPMHSDEGHSFDEREMNRHFQDVESSFLPDATGPAGASAQEEEEGERVGVDDTLMEISKPGQQSSMQGHQLEQVDEEEDSELDTTTPADAYQTAAAARYRSGQQKVESHESSPSSPAEAAAQRTFARFGSASTRPGQSRPTSGTVQGQDNSSPRSGTDSNRRPASKASTVRGAASPPAFDQSQARNTELPPSEASSFLSSPNGDKPSRLGVRPLHRSTRQVSYGSVTSNNTGVSDLSGSDGTFNMDFALQTGGSVSQKSNRGNSRGNILLSRLPSVGSVGTYSEEPSSFQNDVSTNSLLASRAGSRFDGAADEDRPETPRGAASQFTAPTDTVIAQHVQSIQVPETIARDFRLRNRSYSPDKRPASSGGLGASAFQDRPRRTLTLKEQNSKIDKLTKENFDLKLKIHFLDQALQNRSDDGVRELIEKNVQFQTDLANERKESQNLRRKMRDMERKIKEQDEAFAEAMKKQQDAKEELEEEDNPSLQAEMHEEILYLRQQLDHSENVVTTLRDEVMTKEFEKRKMAEHMRGMAGKRGADSAGMQETMDMWQDLLNAETGRREEAEEEISKLRDQLNALRLERTSPVANRGKPDRRRSWVDDEKIEDDLVNGALSNSNAAVEQLKHENAELRRDLGAQTSMLTSRNRERERLQQEIEDLKLLQRKGDGARSLAGESIFDRSVSRAHQRSESRATEHTTEAEREEWDRKEGQLRDQNAELRIKFQELERTHGTHLQYVSVLEGDFQEMETELNECHEDLLKLQTERDEMLQACDEKDQEYTQLKEEALNEIQALDEEKKILEADLQDAENKLQKTQSKLQNTTDGYKGLQGELREITQSVMNLEDEKQANMRTIQTLEQQISEAEDEIQKWEHKCNELDQKNRKLEITQESLHSEITFLREEQEGDKIKIGELEDALNAAQQTIQDEQDRLREVEESVLEERQQRDVLENRSKEDVQKVLDDLNAESSKSKDEVRRLRRALSAKEVDASSWKSKLEDLEQSLRSILGDPDGTKQSLLAEIEKLQRDLDTTASALDRAKMDMSDKDRLLRHRDGLLESTSLESRRLSDLLEKERSSRKHDLEQFEKSARGQATHMRTLAQQETRVLELETAYSTDKRKMANLEREYRDQLEARNNLLFALWNRLSTLCGTDWAQNHSLLNGENPSVETIGKYLREFNTNIISAVKTIEALLGSFKGRIRSIEKDLWKDYQTLEHNLELRVKRMDHLERAVEEAQQAFAEEAARRFQAERQALERGGNTPKAIKHTEEMKVLKTEIKTLKAELKFHRQHPSPMAQQKLNQHLQTGGSGNFDLNLNRSLSTSAGSQHSPSRGMMASLLHRANTSSSSVEHVRHFSSGDAGLGVQQQSQQQAQPIVLAQQQAQPSDQRWVHRLKELERRLKAEREARLLDRKGARQRLEEGRAENEELRGMLEREKGRREFEGLGTGGSESGAGSEGRSLD